MSNAFFDRPILNSPYDYPARYWELDDSRQPTQKIIEHRRRAEFITPIPKPKKQKTPAAQLPMVFDEGKGLATGAGKTTVMAIGWGELLREDKHCQYSVSPTGVVSVVLTNGSTFSNTSGEGESYQAIIKFDLMRNKRETPHNVI